MSKPTKTDPLTTRPLKKSRRALSPTSSQASHLQTLFKNPDQEIRLPNPAPSRKHLPAPPEIVTNVQGSSAGAGSGEFHVYKAARRREYERMRQMDEDLAAEKGAEEFEARRREREREDEEKTRRNREKREKKRKGREGGKKNVKGGKEDGRKVVDGKEGEGDGVKREETAGKKQDADIVAAPDAAAAAAAAAAADGPGLVIHDDD